MKIIYKQCFVSSALQLPIDISEMTFQIFNKHDLENKIKMPVILPSDLPLNFIFNFLFPRNYLELHKIKMIPINVLIAFF